MKLDEFRRLLLNPNSGTAPEMAPLPQILTQPKTKASRVQSKSPNVAKVVVKSPKEYKTTSVITKSKQTASSNSVPENRPKSKEKSVERTIETEDPKPKSCWSLRYYLELPSIWCNKVLNTCQLIIYFPYNLLCWCIAKIYVVIYDTYLLQVIIFVSGLYLSSAISMTYPIFALCRLVLGTLYPAYASYKAVRTKNVREYVKWMMYWIVFAIFTSIETFADIFVAFWFPFYYEMKILVLLWLISPVSKGSLGSSIIYRKFVHPALMKREEEIDHMILRLQEQGYNTVSRLAGRAFRTVSDFVMQTAIRGGGGLVYQLRKSYSLTDLGNQDEYDEGSPQMMRHSDRMRPLPQITDITDECDDDASMTSGGVRRRTRPTTYRQESSTGFRTESSTGFRTESSTGYFFPESDIVDLQQQRRLRSTSFRDTPRHVTRPEIASPDGFSSGYSSSTAELAAFLPMSPDEMMDTEDYELYNPRVQGFRGEGPAKSRSFAVRGSPLHSSKGVTPGRGRARPKQEDFYSDDEGRSYPDSKSSTSRAYPLAHSSSVPMRSNDPAHWQDSGYSRSASSVSVDSVYPSSTSYDDDDDDNEEYWSDTLEDVSQQGLYGSGFAPLDHQLSKNLPFGQFPQFLKPNPGYEDDQDKTPVEAKRFSVTDLYNVAQRLDKITPQGPVEYMAYPTNIVQEKPPPSVAMQNISRGETPATELERPVSRSATGKKTRAPEPPVNQSDAQGIQQRAAPPMSYPQSMTGGLPIKRLSRPITQGNNSATTPIVTEGRPGLSFPINPEPQGLAELPPSGPLRARQPSFSIPIAKNPNTVSPMNKADPSPPNRGPIEERRPPLKFPATRSGAYGPNEPEDADSRSRTRRVDSPQPTMRSLSPTGPLSNSDTSSLSSSPSGAAKCPHCKIHSWLPHSAGCTNKKSS